MLSTPIGAHSAHEEAVQMHVRRYRHFGFSELPFNVMARPYRRIWSEFVIKSRQASGERWRRREVEGRGLITHLCDSTATPVGKQVAADCKPNATFGANYALKITRNQWLGKHMQRPTEIIKEARECCQLRLSESGKKSSCCLQECKCRWADSEMN